MSGIFSLPHTAHSHPDIEDAAAESLATHEAAADPHPGYITPAELAVELAAWTPQRQYIQTDANTDFVAGVQTDLGSGTVTLPAGWVSMDIILVGVLTLQATAAATRGQSNGGIEVVFDAVVNEEYEYALYHETAANVKQSFALTGLATSKTADVSFVVRHTAASTEHGAVVAADQNYVFIKMRNS